MSIRLRLTLLYSAILALTLVLFGAALYGVVYGVTLHAAQEALKADGDNLAIWIHSYGNPLAPAPPPALDTTDTLFQIRRLDGRVLVSNVQGETLPLDASVLAAHGDDGGTVPD